MELYSKSLVKVEYSLFANKSKKLMPERPIRVLNLVSSKASKPIPLNATKKIRPENRIKDISKNDL